MIRVSDTCVDVSGLRSWCQFPESELSTHMKEPVPHLYPQHFLEFNLNNRNEFRITRRVAPVSATTASQRFE